MNGSVVNKNALKSTSYLMTDIICTPPKGSLPGELKIFIEGGNRQDVFERFIVSKPKKLHCPKSTKILSQLSLTFLFALVPQ